MDAEDLLLREFLGIRTAEETEAAARWIRSVQRDDGTWANFRGGDGDLSTTVEAYVALRLAGDRPAAAHMAQAAAWIRDRGGIAATRVFTRIWLALFGEWPWDELPVMPPELIYLPRWFPLNVYDWACWARQTIVPLTVVCSMRPVRALPFSLDELDTQAGQRAPGRSSRRDAGAGARRSLGRGVPRPGPGAAPLRAACRSPRPGDGGPDRGLPAVRRVDHRPARARRLLGRYPAALGLLAHGAAFAGLWPGSSGHRARPGGPGPVHHLGGRTGREDAPAGGLPVTGLGHSAGDDRPGRRWPAGQP